MAGTNSHYPGWDSRAEVDDLLLNAKAMNSNVVRTILHSAIGSLDGTTKPTKWNWQSTGDTSNMGMHGVYLIYWNPSTNHRPGGMSEYLSPLCTPIRGALEKGGTT